jgi:hypothetical protein
MKPLFTIHAGEYLVGSYIEHSFKQLNVWVPTRDTGIDLLVTDAKNRKTVSLQVKFSKDYLATSDNPIVRLGARASGWWTFDRDKLRRSVADYWVLVLLGFASQTEDYIVIPPKELFRRLQRIHSREKTIQAYFLVTERKQCWETRGLGREERLAPDRFKGGPRDFTQWLNDWTPVKRLRAGR